MMLSRLALVAGFLLAGQAVAQAQPGDAEFCRRYAAAAATAAQDAIAINPACLDPGKGVHPDRRSHMEWCARTPSQDVEGAATHIARLASRCTQGALATPTDYGGFDIAGANQKFERPYGAARDWDILSASSGGTFMYCVAVPKSGGRDGRIGNDTTVLNGFGQWQVAVPVPARKDWQGPLEIDGKGSGNGGGNNISGASVPGWAIAWLSMGDIDAMRKGRTAVLGVGKQDYDFALDGVAAAILKVEECRSRRGVVAAAAPASPPSIAAAPTPPPISAAPQTPAPVAAKGRPANCTLIVDGKSYIDGVCDFDADRDGSFRVRGGDYFAYVSVSGPGVASASWNADPQSTHAQTSLGDVVRKGPCWENARTRICARDLPQGQRAAVAASRPNGEMVTPEFPGASQACVAPPDGGWVAGAKLVLRNCRPDTDKGFSRRDGFDVSVMNGALCVVSPGDGLPLELAACGAAAAWSWEGTVAVGKPVRNADGRCWAIPALDDPKAVFPFPVVAAPCNARGKPPLAFSFSKD